MTRDEAQLILQAYRPGGQDAADPQFAEALEMLRHDAELARWFAEEQAWDAAVSAGLKSVEVPPNLRRAILAGGEVIQRLVWWQLINWRRVAAFTLIMLVGAGFFLFSLNRTQGLIAASRDARYFAEMRAGHLRTQTNDLATVRQLFRKCHAPVDFEVPAGLSKLPMTGGALVGMRSTTASVLVFRLVGNQHLMLAVMDQMQDDIIPSEGRVRVVQDGDWATAFWTKGGKTYLLWGRVPPESLRQILI